MSHRTAPGASGGDAVPVCLYLRCSSPQQELSVDDQRRELTPFCERKGYRVVREYIDEGRSASKEPEKRVAFNRMVADSAKDEFRVVVCYDASRFTRVDNIEGSLPKQMLRGNGVILDTVKEGEFDWRTPEGRWKDMAYCEANKAASLNISKDALRGRMNVLKLGLGYWPSGVVPYGYDREYTDGVRTVAVKRHEPFKKGKGWHLRLVMDEAEAKIVREVFDLFVNKRWSRRAIGIELTKRKVPSPKSNAGVTSGAWNEASVTTTLLQKAYVGVATLGMGRNTRKSAHNRVTPAEQENACPVIVERRVWEDAQEITRERRASKSKPQSSRAGVLSGLLFCGHCGFRLIKRPGALGVQYCCVSRKVRQHPTCRHWGVYEDELLPKVSAWLVQAVDSEVMMRLMAEPPGAGESSEEEMLADQAAALAEKVKGGTESALLAPPVAREKAWGMVAEWQRELESAEQRLALVRAVRNAPEFDGFAEWWASVKDQLILVDTTSLLEGFVPGGPVDPNSFAVGNPSAILTPVDRDRMRGLLFHMGFACKLWWKERDSRNGRADRMFEVQDVQIEASLSNGGVAFIPSSTRTRAATTTCRASSRRGRTRAASPNSWSGSKTRRTASASRRTSRTACRGGTTTSPRSAATGRVCSSAVAAPTKA